METIQGGNKTIAVFDGWKFEEASKGKPYKIWRPDFIDENNEPPDDWVYSTWIKEDFEAYLKVHLRYDKSWDALMPVVEKIAKIVYEEGFEDGERILDTAYPRTFGMINSETGEFMVRINRCSIFSAPTLIEAAWKAVVDFIESDNPTRNKE